MYDCPVVYQCTVIPVGMSGRVWACLTPVGCPCATFTHYSSNCGETLTNCGHIREGFCESKY